MERLTKRGYKKQALLIGTSCSYGYMSYDCKLKEGNVLLKSALDKLADYEDLEKQGRLVKLPCKVGDTVYAIGFNNNKPIIYESVVLSILITEKEIAFNVKVDEFEINLQLKQSMFDKTVFLTKSEAEAKLKELRGGENG